LVITSHWLDVTRVSQVTIQICQVEDQKKDEREQVHGKNCKHSLPLISEKGGCSPKKICGGNENQNNQKKIDVNIPTHYKDGEYGNRENDEEESTGSKSQTNIRFLHKTKKVKQFTILTASLDFLRRFECTSFDRDTPFILDFSRNNATNCRFLGMISFNVWYHLLYTDGTLCLSVR